LALVAQRLGRQQTNAVAQVAIPYSAPSPQQVAVVAAAARVANLPLVAALVVAAQVVLHKPVAQEIPQAPARRREIREAPEAGLRQITVVPAVAAHRLLAVTVQVQLAVMAAQAPHQALAAALSLTQVVAVAALMLAARLVLAVQEAVAQGQSRQPQQRLEPLTRVAAAVVAHRLLQ